VNVGVVMDVTELSILDVVRLCNDIDSIAIIPHNEYCCMQCFNADFGDITLSIG